MIKLNCMRIYLADLAHDYFSTTQFTPTGVGFIASYAKSKLGDKVEFELFKSATELLDEIEKNPPDLVGFANYTWNAALSKFAGEWIKTHYPDMPVVMGGPNIRTDEKGIEAFLKNNPYVDQYCMYAGEISFYEILTQLLNLPSHQRNAHTLRQTRIDGCYSIVNDALAGNNKYKTFDDLDEIPSPFLNGILDSFLKKGFLPIIETNRGCPFSCTFCVWGISALSKVRRFSMDRVKSELDYIAKGRKASVLSLADANFGILPRDVEIAQHIRDLFEETKSFSRVQLYWAKISKPHMVDIGKILGHLTQTYIAFQSLDPVVLSNIKRKNIKTEALMDLIEKLKGFTHGAQTDILVGLPGESYESHLNSLDKALSFGINYIYGGEIRMLPGAEMDTEESRQEFGLRTKYRMFEGGYGKYRGKFVYELEEAVRETKAMSEDEMLKLRILRAFFYGSVTLGEHLPLVHYLINRDIRFTKLCEELVNEGSEDPIFKECVNWLRAQSIGEWFDTPQDAERFTADPRHQDALLKDDAFVKLNTGFFAKIILDNNLYQAYYRVLEKSVLKLDPSANQPILREILEICRERNFLYRKLHGDSTRKIIIKVLSETLEALKESGYLPKEQTDQRLHLVIDDVTAELCASFVEQHPHMTVLDLSQILILHPGRFLMKPAKQKVAAPRLVQVS